jgi:hypothetical protein
VAPTEASAVTDGPAEAPTAASAAPEELAVIAAAPPPGPDDAATSPEEPTVPPAVAPPAEPTSVVPRLIAERVAGLEPGSVHEIGDGVMLGRGKSASIRLSDPLASGRHARIAPDGERVVLTDLGSTNGSFLNGVLLSAPTPLTNGDRIRLGESDFLYQSQSIPPLPPAPPLPEGETTISPPAPGEDQDTTADPAEGPSVQTTGAAVPLLAEPVAERSLELDGLGEEAAPMLPPAPPGLPPAPHRDAPVIAVGPDQVAPPAAPLRRLRRGASSDVDEEPGPRRRTRRLRGTGDPPSELTVGRRRLAVVGVVVVLAVIAFAVVELGGSPSKGTGGGATTPPATTSGSHSAATKTPTVAPPARATITVAVLNGTTQSGLAGIVSTTLTTDGFAKGEVSNAPGAAAVTTVGYSPGHRAGAAEVADVLHLPASSVTAVASTTLAAASTTGGAPKVVVTIGANYKQ